ncbi:MAG: hypothetical protein KAR42_04700 [candidate division Zixibacteria bacterium]|nr:hypothetical protein [candidate division Zixibacteria bacterium]
MHDWSEQVTSSLLIQSVQHQLPVYFNKQLLALRRIEKIVYNSQLFEHGKLTIDKDNFVIHINPVSKGRKNKKRFVIAHEIAHTFLYDISTWPPTPHIKHSISVNDIEWFCDYLARSLLIPRQSIENIVSKSAKPGSDDFSLRLLRDLSEVCKLYWKIVARRLVEDLSLWKCVLLQFELLYLKKDPNKQYTFPSWRLVWHTKSPETEGDLFIPYGRFDSGIKKYPRVTGKLECVLYDIIDRAESNCYINMQIPSNVFVSSALGNLKSFIISILKKSELRADIVVNVAANRDMFKSQFHYLPNSKILLCIGLEQ